LLVHPVWRARRARARVLRPVGEAGQRGVELGAALLDVAAPMARSASARSWPVGRQHAGRPHPASVSATSSASAAFISVPLGLLRCRAVESVADHRALLALVWPAASAPPPAPRGARCPRCTARCTRSFSASAWASARRAPVASAHVRAAVARAAVELLGEDEIGLAERIVLDELRHLQAPTWGVRGRVDAELRLQLLVGMRRDRRQLGGRLGPEQPVDHAA